MYGRSNCVYILVNKANTKAKLQQQQCYSKNGKIHLQQEPIDLTEQLKNNEKFTQLQLTNSNIFDLMFYPPQIFNNQMVLFFHDYFLQIKQGKINIFNTFTDEQKIQQLKLRHKVSNHRVQLNKCLYYVDNVTIQFKSCKLNKFSSLLDYDNIKSISIDNQDTSIQLDDIKGENILKFTKSSGFHTTSCINQNLKFISCYNALGVKQNERKRQLKQKILYIEQSIIKSQYILILLLIQLIIFNQQLFWLFKQSFNSLIKFCKTKFNKENFRTIKYDNIYYSILYQFNEFFTLKIENISLAERLVDQLRLPQQYTELFENLIVQNLMIKYKTNQQNDKVITKVLKELLNNITNLHIDTFIPEFISNKKLVFEKPQLECPICKSNGIPIILSCGHQCCSRCYSRRCQYCSSYNMFVLIDFTKFQINSNIICPYGCNRSLPIYKLDNHIQNFHSQGLLDIREQYLQSNGQPLNKQNNTQYNQQHNNQQIQPIQNKMSQLLNKQQNNYQMQDKSSADYVQLDNIQVQNKCQTCEQVKQILNCQQDQIVEQIYDLKQLNRSLQQDNYNIKKKQHNLQQQNEIMVSQLNDQQEQIHQLHKNSIKYLQNYQPFYQESKQNYQSIQPNYQFTAKKDQYKQQKINSDLASIYDFSYQPFHVSQQQYAKQQQKPHYRQYLPYKQQKYEYQTYSKQNNMGSCFAQLQKSLNQSHSYAQQLSSNKFYVCSSQVH